MRGRKKEAKAHLFKKLLNYKETKKRKYSFDAI